MKKLMLGTTALVAASALTAGTASAAEKISLNVGGYMQSHFIYADYDDDDRSGQFCKVIGFHNRFCDCLRQRIHQAGCFCVFIRFTGVPTVDFAGDV